MNFSARSFTRDFRTVAVILGVASMAAGAPGTAHAQSPRAPAAQAAPIIQRIAVEGTQRIEPDSVLSYMVLRQGDPYTAEAADRSVKTLFDTGLFADVRTSWDGSTLTVRVVENPILNQVVFEGNSKLSEKDLTKEVQVKPRMVFTRAKVQADVSRIIELYRRAGRFGATVEPKIIQRPQNRVDLVFEIHEGETTGVARISFIGNKVFSDSELRSEIVTTESSWWKILATNDNYDPDRLTFDREQLRRFYLQRGYADFHVVSAVAELAPDRSSFYITFTVEEGDLYKFGKIDVQSQIRELNPAELMPLLPTKEGETYDASQIDKAVEALTYAAGTKGFVFLDIRPRVRRDRETKTIEVIYQIDPAPRVYVERINIKGNTRTRDEVIRREMRIDEGDAFNRVLVDRSRTRVRALGFFKDVKVEEEPGSASDRTVLNVTVEEQPTGELSLGAGYSSQNAFLAEFSYTERNLFGRGQFLRASVSLSSLQKEYDFRFTEPYFMGRPLAAGFQLYKVVTDYSDQVGYLSDVNALGFLFGFPVSEFGRISPHYNFQIAELTATALAPLEVILSSGSATTSSIGFTYTYDTRDDRAKPTKGWNLSFSQDFAGLGGDLKYLRSVINTEFYQPIFTESLIGQLSFSAGYISSYGGQEMRINERFFKGGNTFRGFEIAGIGPRDINSFSRVALGGQFFAVGTFQVRLPPILPEDYGISFSLFNDIGTVGILHGVDMTCTALSCVKDDLSPRAAAGLSIAWRSPFGPVQIDLAYPYLKEEYDRTQYLRFSTATNF